MEVELKGDILHLKESIQRFAGEDKCHWYFDIKHWRQSSNGKKGDKIDRRMSSGQIDLVKKYYLPLARKG